MQKNCEFADMCPLFEKFYSSELTMVWINMYCRGTLVEECARRKLRIAGEEVPLSLLPNGDHNANLA